jgi:hypothetical protein
MLPIVIKRARFFVLRKLFLPLFYYYHFQAVCKTAKEIAKPIIAENTAKYKIDSVEFETLTLGSLPPVFQG